MAGVQAAEDSPEAIIPPHLAGDDSRPGAASSTQQQRGTTPHSRGGNPHGTLSPVAADGDRPSTASWGFADEPQDAKESPLSKTAPSKPSRKMQTSQSVPAALFPKSPYTLSLRSAKPLAIGAATGGGVPRRRRRAKKGRGKQQQQRAAHTPKGLSPVRLAPIGDKASADDGDAASATVARQLPNHQLLVQVIGERSGRTLARVVVRASCSVAHVRTMLLRYFSATLPSRGAFELAPPGGGASVRARNERKTVVTDVAVLSAAAGLLDDTASQSSVLTADDEDTNPRHDGAGGGAGGADGLPVALLVLRTVAGAAPAAGTAGRTKRRRAGGGGSGAVAVAAAAASAAAAAAAKKAGKAEAPANVEDFFRMRALAMREDEMMATAEANGTYALLGRLDTFLRRYQLRLGDLFKAVDTSGDERLCAEELKDALGRANLVVALEQAEKLVGFLDRSGDGFIQAGELNAAVRAHRKHARRALAVAAQAASAGARRKTAGARSRKGKPRPAAGGGSNEEGFVDPEALLRTVERAAPLAPSQRQLALLKPISLGRGAKARPPSLRAAAASASCSSIAVENAWETESAGPASGGYGTVVATVGGGTVGFGAADAASFAGGGASLASQASVATGFYGAASTIGVPTSLAGPAAAAAAAAAPPVPEPSSLALSDARIEAVLTHVAQTLGEKASVAGVSLGAFANALRAGAEGASGNDSGDAGLTRGVSAAFGLTTGDDADTAAADGAAVADACARTLRTLAWLQEAWAKSRLESHLDGLPRPLTEQEVVTVARFLDPNGDGIDLGELESAFRSVARAQAAQLMGKAELAAMTHLSKRIKSESIDVGELMARLAEEDDEEGNDGTVAIGEMQKALVGLGVAPEDAALVGKFVDPNGDGRVDAWELESALRRAVRTEEALGAAAAVEAAAEAQRASLARLETEYEATCASRFTEPELSLLTQYLDESGDGEISVDELHAAFRKARRARATEAAAELGRGLLRRIVALMKQAGLELDEWFESMDSAGAASADGTITARELGIGLQRLADSCKAPRFSGKELGLMVKFMDPSGDAELSSYEVRDAFDQIDDPSAAHAVRARCGPVLRRLEDFISGRALRLNDFFAELDDSGDGSINLEELKAGLERITAPSGTVRGLMAAKARALDRLRGEVDARRAADAVLQARLDECEASGAAEVLRRLGARMVERGLRLSDIFNEMDESGDGVVGVDELAAGLNRIVELSPAVLQAVTKRRRAKAQHNAEEKVKRANYAAFCARMEAAVASGADVALERLAEHMRKWQLRVADLFRGVDTTGDGIIDADELHAALKKAGLPSTVPEAKRVVAYLDTGGDGTIDAAELEAAVRQFRRFNYEREYARRYRKKGAGAGGSLDVRYDGFGEIFAAADARGDVTGTLTAGDLRAGLKRLRGDRVAPPSASAAAGGSDPLASGLRKAREFFLADPPRAEAVLAALPAEGQGAAAPAAPAGAVLEMLEAIRTDGSVVVARERDAATAAAAEDAAAAADAADGGGSLAGTAALPAPALTDAQLEQAVAFLDGGDGEVDANELSNAFRLVRGGGMADMTDEALAGAAQLLDHLRAKGKGGLDAFLREAAGDDATVETHELQHSLVALGVDEANAEALCAQVDPSGDGAVDAFELGEGLRRAERAFETKRRGRAAEKLNEDAAVVRRLEGELENASARFSADELTALFAFLDPNGDGDVTLEELGAVFRRVRRATATAASARRGRKLCRQLHGLIQAAGLTVEAWYAKCDAAGAASADGQITHRELRLGLKRLCAKAKRRPFSEDSLVLLVRQMDPSGDGALGLDEVNAAFAVMNEKVDADVIEAEVGPVLRSLDLFMRSRGLRLLGFFLKLDADGSGSVGVPEMREALERITTPSDRTRRMIAAKAADLEARRDAIAQLQKLEEAQRELLAGAEASGAADVLRRLEARMKQKGMKLTDIFTELDSDGSGTISLAELSEGLRRIVEPSARARLAMRKRQEAVERRRAEAAERTEKDAAFDERMRELDASGATVAVRAVEELMRASQLRVADIFSVVDRSGDGAVSAEELREALVRAKLDVSAADCAAVVAALDASGEGTLEAAELEDAIRQYRRFSWERQQREWHLQRHAAEAKRQAKLGAGAPGLLTSDEAGAVVGALARAAGAFDGGADGVPLGLVRRVLAPGVDPPAELDLGFDEAAADALAAPMRRAAPSRRIMQATAQCLSRASAAAEDQRSAFLQERRNAAEERRAAAMELQEAVLGG